MISCRQSGFFVAWAFCAALCLAGCSGGGGDSSEGAGAPLPAVVHVNKVPDQTVYGLGAPVEVATLVLDSAGGTIAGASVQLVSVPPADQQTGNQFVYLNDGVYTITATVLGATQGGLPVTASLTVSVDGHGPAIACANPIDGAILNQAPGTITVQGSVDDLNGVSAFSVNGAPVAVGASGAFTTPVNAAWGINFVDLAAVDGVGREARRTCAFLLSDTWAPDTDILSSTISFRNAQASFDDGVRAGSINSFADALHAVVNSTGLRNTLNSALLAANPLEPFTCHQSVLGICVLSSQITYLGLDLPAGALLGTTSQSLVTGGVSNASRVSSIRLRLRANGSAAFVPYDATGLVAIDFVNNTMTFDTSLSGGRPRITIRAGSVSVQVGTITLDFTGLDGFVIDLVAALAQGTIRNIAANTIQSFITNNFSSILDGIMSGLDVRNLPVTFDVPRLDGASPVAVNFATGFSTLNTSTTRMLTSMGTRFNATPAHARPTLGAPVPPGTRLLDPSTNAPVTIASALHVGLLDQALHALWRGGYFDATLTGGALNGLVPAGATLGLATTLPPAATLRDDGRIEIALGAVNVHVEDPALLGVPIDASLGGRVSCAIRLSAEKLVLENCTVDELHVSTGRIVPDSQTGAALDQLLGDVLNRVLSTAANDALPALPLPAFRLPASVAAFGLPAGADLGLVNPTLVASGRHMIVRGQFGIR
jgi:hypothetical protein